MDSERLFKSKMALYGDTINSLSEEMGLVRQTVSRRIQNGCGWLDEEIAFLAKRYKLTDKEIIMMFNLKGKD